MPAPYLVLATQTADGYAATVPDLDTVLVSADTLDELRTNAAEAIALYLLEMPDAPAPHARSVADTAPEVQADYPDPTELLIEPAPVNPVSLEVAAAIEATGKSLRQLGAEVGISYAVLARLQNPFYWGHSLASLRVLAEKLGRRLEVRLPQAS